MVHSTEATQYANRVTGGRPPKRMLRKVLRSTRGSGAAATSDATLRSACIASGVAIAT